MSRSQLVARNVVVTLATQLVSWGLSFAVTLYLPRYIGDTGLGKLSFAISFITIFGVFVPLGTSTVLVKEIARDRGRTGELLLAAILMRIPLGLLMTALAIGAVHALGYSSLTRLLVTVAALGMIVGTLNDALGAALQGQENMPRQSLAVIIEKFLSSGITIALVILKAPLWSLAAVGLFTGTVSVLVNLTAFKSLLTTLRWPSIATLRFLLIAGMPFMGWTVFRTMYGQSDPVVIKLLTDDATVGWYAAAFRLIGTTLFLPTAITTALLPTLARLHRENPADFRSLGRRMLALIMLCGVPIAFVLLALPGRLITLMHYPIGFVHSIPVLQVGGIGVLLWYAASVLGTLIIASDGESMMFKSSIAATVIGIPLCFAGTWLAKHYLANGAVGAIGSDVAVEVFLLIAYLKILPKNTFNRECLSLLIRYAVASIPMAAFFEWFGPRTHMGLFIFIPCAAIYFFACLSLRCLSWREVILLRSVLTKKLIPA